MFEASLIMLLTAFLIWGITILRMVVSYQNKEALKILIKDTNAEVAIDHEPIRTHRSTKQHVVLSEIADQSKNRI